MPAEAAFQAQAGAACGTRASCMHGMRNMQLAGSPAVANRPAEAALCLESRASIWTRIYHPNMPDLAGTFLRTKQAHTNMRPLDGRDLLAPCASLPPYRSTSRGRMRGIGATCTAPTTHGRFERMTARNTARSAQAARTQRRRRSVRTVSSSLAATESLGVSPQTADWLAVSIVCITREDPRDESRVRRPGDRHAPMIRQESEGGISRRVRRQPGADACT